MGVRYPSVATTTFIGPLPASSVETVVLTAPPLTLPLDFAQVFLQWFFCLTIGTGTTTLVFRIRRGTTTGGFLVPAGSWFTPVTAGAVDFRTGFYVDTPGAVAGQQYSLTVIQNGATGAGAFTDGCLAAYSL